jgi:hypothetical protein
LLLSSNAPTLLGPPENLPAKGVGGHSPAGDEVERKRSRSEAGAHARPVVRCERITLATRIDAVPETLISDSPVTLTKRRNGGAHFSIASTTYRTMLSSHAPKKVTSHKFPPLIKVPFGGLPTEFPGRSGTRDY